ncbi:MAG: substrate-binding domain-containing protein [Cyclobacteriaceae bacterium]
MKKVYLVLIGLFLFSCSENKVYEVKLKGSESMNEVFAALKKDFEEMQDSVKVSLEGGGSKTGLLAIANSETDIGLSSFGFDLDSVLGAGHGVEEQVVAFDGIVLINNEQNKIRQLTNEQINGIYSGKIADWSQLGEAEGPILPIVRDQNSGTQKLFTEYFGITHLATKAVIAKENVEIVSKVIENKNAIGFIGFAYFSIGVNDILIPSQSESDSTVNYVLPSSATITNNIYPLKRPLRIYFRNNENPGQSAFLEYLNSGRGKNVIASFDLLTNVNQQFMAEK